MTWLSRLLAEENLLATAVRDSKDCATGIFIYIIFIFHEHLIPSFGPVVVATRGVEVTSSAYKGADLCYI